MQRWLMKTEPSVFSIDDLARRKTEPWDGVRNYQARNYLRAMRRGDAVLLYHSNCAETGVAGVARITSTAKPDPTQFDAGNPHYDAASDPADPRWSLVDVAFVRKFPRIVTLDEIKQLPNLGDFALTRRGNRLSVLPVSDAQWQAIVALANSR